MWVLKAIAALLAVMSVQGLGAQVEDEGMNYFLIYITAKKSGAEAGNECMQTLVRKYRVSGYRQRCGTHSTVMNSLNQCVFGIDPTRSDRDLNIRKASGQQIERDISGIVTEPCVANYSRPFKGF